MTEGWGPEEQDEMYLAQVYSSRVAMAKAYGETITQLKADLTKLEKQLAEAQQFIFDMGASTKEVK